ASGALSEVRRLARGRRSHRDSHTVKPPKIHPEPRPRGRPGISLSGCRSIPRNQMSSFQIDFGKQERVVGIDLGTTNSLVAFMDFTGPKIIPGEDGEKLVPSVVSIVEAGGVVVGNPAKELLLTQPERTVY